MGKTKKESKPHLNPQYYQGILQVRNPNKDVISFIRAEFDKEKTARIAKEAKVRGGLDIYSSSNKFSRKLGRKLTQKYGGEVKESAKLFSRDKITSKNIYRLNVLYRVPEFIKGDVISVSDGGKAKVIKFGSQIKTKIVGIDLETGKKIQILLKDKKIEKLKKYRTHVAKIKPNLELLDPETFQPTEPVNPKNGFKPGEKVKVVVSEGRVYLV